MTQPRIMYYSYVFINNLQPDQITSLFQIGVKNDTFSSHYTLCFYLEMLTIVYFNAFLSFAEKFSLAFLTRFGDGVIYKYNSVQFVLIQIKY